jgi:hypothetical protein
MAFPSDNQSVTQLFGASAAISSNGDNTLTIDLSELPDVTTPEGLTAEGCVLAILNKLLAGQADATDRKMTVTAQAPAIVQRGGLDALRERFTIDIFHQHTTDIDPDDI